jgi:PAS domain S-box-containing protein
MGARNEGTDVEQRRIAALEALRILDTPEEPVFDRLTEIAARVFAAPVALIWLIDRHPGWVKYRVGFIIREITREGSFCAGAVESADVTVVSDGDFPFGGMRVKFCAVAPLADPEGNRFGALAVMDTRRRGGPTGEEKATLADLAAIVMHQIGKPPRQPESAGGDARFRALMESASQGILAVDQRGCIEIANHQAEALFGYPREELLGQPIEKLLPQALRHAHASHRDGYFGRPHPRPMGIGMELAGQRKNGEQFPVEISLNYVQMDGHPLAIAFITDISERLRLEAQLRQSQKMEAIGQLAGGVAHDFNNLLTIIQGYAAMSLDGIDPNDPVKESLEEIEKAAASAGGLTRQLLSFSRRQSVQLRRLDLNTTIKQVEKMLRRVIGEDVDLVLDTADDLYEISGDPGLIEQVLLNLSVNARDAMPEGGRLILETANLTLDKEYAGAHLAVKTGPHAMLAVSDTGVGMTEEVRAHIFEPFYTTKPQGEGTGLGLATVYGIVKQLNGTIWVYSEPGKGTTFKILFPAAQREEIEAAEAAEAGAAGRGGETVLLVEDEEGVRKFIRAMLERQGYRVLEAGDSDAALRIAADESQALDMLLTDVIMPKENGPEMAAKVAELRPELPVLYMSGYTDRAIRLQDQIGGANFIQKPFTPAALGAKIREMLAGARESGSQLQ